MTSPKDESIKWKTEDKRTPAALEQMDDDCHQAMTVIEYQPNGRVREVRTAVAEASIRSINNLKDYVYWKNSREAENHKSFIKEFKHFERELQD